jgi:hypothetical protein
LEETTREELVKPLISKFLTVKDVIVFPVKTSGVYLVRGYHLETRRAYND